MPAVAQRGVVQTEVEQCLPDGVELRAGGRDAERGTGCLDLDDVELVGGRIRLNHRGTRAHERRLGLEAVGRREHGELLVAPGLALPLDLGEDDPLGSEVGVDGEESVGDVGHDLESDPAPRHARERHGVQAHRDDLCGIARVQDGDTHGSQ